MKKILAIDASTEACSAALLNGEQLLERYTVAERKHTELILPMVDEVLSDAGLTLHQLDAIAFNRGPGSFTGVRVSASVAQGLAYAMDLPVIPVSGLASIAQRAWTSTGEHRLLVVQDARMNEVYWASYQVENGRITLLGEEHVSKITDIDKPAGADWLAVGNGISVYNDELNTWADTQGVRLHNEILLPQAKEVAQLAMPELQAGNEVDAMHAQPVYIRDKVV
jgi:tRNA threonylcarbamoyladenosine biosynthesis protein TsaB